MNFLSTWSLLLFLPLAGAVILLYLLKLKRKEHIVSSVMLWRDAVADIQANAPFQKLKKSLLLISENKIVVILDSSASMQSTDVSPSRFENAKSRALGIVRKMGPGDTMLVITAGAKTRVVSSFTSDKKALASAISGLRPVDTGCNMRQAMVLAMSLVAGKSAAPPRIVVLSDGGFGELSDLPAKDARLDYLKIGSRCDNVAITGLDSRKTLSGQQQVFIGLRSFSNRERAFNLEIYLGDQLLDIREESLKPGEQKQEILGNLGTASGRVTAKLDVKDDLAADNSGSVYLAGRRAISVLMGNIFLQNALSLDPRTQLTRSDACPAGLAKRAIDLVIFDCVQPPSSLPPGGYLLVNTSSAQGPADAGKAVPRPTIIDSDKRHPVSAYVDFSGVRMAEASRLSPKPWATKLVESDGGALAVAGTRNGRRYVQLGFSLLESDFPLHVGFPIFITNCLDWLAPTKGAGAASTVRTGQPAYIDVPPGLSEITVTGPDNVKHKLRVKQTPVVCDYTDRAGVYRVQGKGFDREFACNLSSSDESDTRPRTALLIGGRRFASSGKAVRTNREFYAIAIFLALAVLTFEWYAYHRRL
jgi:Ca-activated chloride channel family protein